MIHAEAQLMVAECPLEIESGRLASIGSREHRAAAAATQIGERSPHGSPVLDAAALDVGIAGDRGVALVLAVQRLDREVVGEVPGIGRRPVQAARFTVTGVLIGAALIGRERVGEGIGHTLVFV
jgi:hypothetical protein